MNRKSYYDVGMNDYEYFKQVMCANLDYPSYNGIAVQAQNTDCLRSHKLVNLYNTIIAQGIDIELKKDDLRFLTDFYFDARYPSNDYIIVTLEDAKRAIVIVDQVLTCINRVREASK